MQKFKLSCVVLLSGIALAGCSADMQNTNSQAEIQANNALVQQSELGVNWVQQSGEYEALAIQAYNDAKQAYIQSRVPRGMKKAVIVDLDETVLNNSAYAGWQVQHNQQFTGESWNRWVNAKEAKAIPGSKAFINYVNTHGGTVFYVSNRSVKNLAPTMENMKALGYTGVVPSRFYLKTDSSNKQARFDQIKKLGYDVVVYMGDNLNDFGAATYHKDNQQRRDFVQTNSKLFGSKFFVLPNPTYGDWVPGLANGYYGLDNIQKVKVHADSIQAWDGK